MRLHFQVLVGTLVGFEALLSRITNTELEGGVTVHGVTSKASANRALGPSSHDEEFGGRMIKVFIVIPNHGGQTLTVHIDDASCVRELKSITGNMLT